MLALPLALLIALPATHVPPSTQIQLKKADTPVASQEVAYSASALIPHGTASGAWATGVLYEDGALVALLEDSSGRPLFALDARLSPTGEVSGELLTLEYAGNPALILPQLRVIGLAQVPAAGNGSFSLVIYNPLEDDGYVFPQGRIEGVLLRDQGPITQPGNGKEVASLLVQSTQSTEVHVANAIQGAFVPAAETASGTSTVETAQSVQSVDRAQRFDPFTVAGSAAAANRGRVEGCVPHTFMIVCPYEPPSGQGQVLARWILYL